MPLRMTGKLMYLKNEFGHLSVMRYPKTGRSAPMRKKNTSPLDEGRELVAFHVGTKRGSDVLIDLTIGELPRRPDDTPDDGSSPEHLCRWAL